MIDNDTAHEHDEHVFGHEADHADARKITIAVVGLALLAVGGVVIVWGILAMLEAPQQRNLLAAPEPVTPRPAIRGALNPQQPETLSELRNRAQMRLSSYGWVQREAEVAHIPIERAMELIAERGTPDWPAPASGEQADGDPQDTR